MMLSHINQPIAKLATLWQTFVETRVSMQRLGEVLDIPLENHDDEGKTPQVFKGSIVFSAVNFRYQSDSPLVLKGLSFEIRAGEHIGIVGSSGCGKSTITRLMQRFYTPESGTIWVDNVPIQALAVSDLRRQVSVVLQDSYLFNLSVRDNIALKHPCASLEMVVEAAKIAGAHDFILRLAAGYDTILSESGCSLSGGQRQRIAIARALMGMPSLIILDEATGALDDETQQLLFNNMQRVMAEKSLITIAHRLSSVKACDRILFLHEGQIVEQGTHQSLLTKGGHYARLWSLQSETLEVDYERL